MKNATDIFDAIAQRIDSSNDDVRERVIEARVEKVRVERAELLDKGLEKIEAADAELKKLKECDQKSYDDSFNVVGQSYSQERVKQLKKAKENKDKLEAAFSKALNGDCDSLKKLVK